MYGTAFSTGARLHPASAAPATVKPAMRRKSRRVWVSKGVVSPESSGTMQKSPCGFHSARLCQYRCVSSWDNYLPRLKDDNPCSPELRVPTFLEFPFD